MNKCTINQCNKPIRAKGMCGAHRIRYLHGKPMDKPIRTRMLHGLTKHPLYKTWQGMRSRCNVVSDGQYEYYGGRGIKVCDRWDNFALFVADMGERPDGYSIDRKDVNGNYEPGNCRWATWKTQVHNQRISSRNKSGYTGVHWEERRKRWLVNLAVDRKTIYIGRYETLGEAIKARQEAGEKYHGI